MRVPEIVHVDDLRDNTESVLIDGYYHVAKAKGFQGLMLRKRLICAWMVLIGKYDVLVYKEDYKEK